ncbi:MAG TPA: Gfo/Idh/MocA family oxidoreductase [Candidatus Methylomirabilis sp.]|nr:Gfo/Idh/MocA family oxidoreductase [Candidatus Methylomirabilis sp.]
MLRGAVVGLGNVAVHGHLPGWLSRRDVEIVAVTDVDPARRAAGAERLPAARWYDSAALMMAEAELDFVDICTPPSSHAGLIRAALERGLHVLCEKPLVGSLDELRSLADLAAAADRALHTVHNWHHAPIVKEVRTLVSGGAVGRVTAASWQTLRTRPAASAGGAAENWRLDPAIAGGGVLTDHGWHVSYILQRWLGATPLAVGARLETRRHTRWPVEDTASLRLRFPEAVADVLLTWAADERRNWARLEGSEGVLDIADDVLMLRREGGERRWSFTSGLSDGSQHPEWFHGVADQFLARVTDRAGDADNLAEATACLAVEALARASSRQGGRELPLGAEAVLTRPELSV